MTTDKKKHDKLLSLFSPHKDYQVDDYYGASIMTLKKNRKESIKLIHDYIGGNGRFSSSITVNNVDDAVEVMRLLHKYRKVDEEVSNVDFLSEDEPTDENLDKNIISDKGLENEENSNDTSDEDRLRNNVEAQGAESEDESIKHERSSGVSIEPTEEVISTEQYETLTNEVFTTEDEEKLMRDYEKDQILKDEA